VASVVEYRAVPLGMKSLSRVGVLEQIRAVEIGESVRVGRKMRRHPVEDQPYPVLMQHVDEVHEVLRRPVARGRREKSRRLISPRSVEGMLGDGHELDMRESHVSRVYGQRLCDISVPRQSVIVTAPPRSEMNLIDR